MSSSSPIILFYSASCPHSKKFISALDKLGIRSSFQLVSVDKNKAGQRPRVVSTYSIKEVPTLIVRNQKIAGQSAFTWLMDEVKRFNNNKQRIQSGRQQQQPRRDNFADVSHAGNGTAGNTLEPVDFSGSSNILGGSSYVYIDGSESNSPSGRFAVAGSVQEITPTISEDSSFVKPENNFIVPSALSQQTQSIIEAASPGENPLAAQKTNKRSTKKLDKDLTQLLEERKREITPRGGFNPTMPR